MDIVDRLKSLIPARWASGPRADALIGGVSDALQVAVDFLAYARLQVRLRTATGVWLDMAAQDFLGRTLLRRSGESDKSFRERFVRELFRERVTRAAMSSVLADLTGSTPKIFEPWNTGDTGAWGVGAIAWDTAGGWGSQLMPAQALIIPGVGVSGIAMVGGWYSDEPAFSDDFDYLGFGPVTTCTDFPGGWNVGSIAWVGDDEATSAVTERDILDAINATRPTGVTVWTPITL